MSVKEHYDRHLGKFYSWMAGDFEAEQSLFQKFLYENKIVPASSKKAIDLGAGHGIQSVSLAMMGFEVTAVDFSEQLWEN